MVTLWRCLFFSEVCLVMDRESAADTMVLSCDSGGRVLKFDVREDEEQSVKLKEITELLVAAGYFRGRIKGLSDFDRVIGGMCWAIQLCDVGLDTDLLFNENLSIGQKIALTEKIVTVLNNMKCPYRLEPHQMSLQGMDCIHMFPVVQWLIKKSIETRSSREKSIRRHAIKQFDRKHLLLLVSYVI